MPDYIINLATLHSLTWDRVINAFVELRDQYLHPTGCLAKHKDLNHLTNGAWIMLKKRELDNTIEQYKKGKTTTPLFLESLLRSLPFLNRTYPDSLKDTLFGKKEEYLILKDITSRKALTDHYVALALIEEAWNKLIDFTPRDKKNFQHLQKIADGNKSIYLISNTNPLHVYFIFRQFKAYGPAGFWEEHPNIDTPAQPDQTPVRLGKNISLCVSYRFGNYKTSGLLAGLMEGTPPTLISQWGEDRFVAANLRMTITRPEHFYPHYPAPRCTIPGCASIVSLCQTGITLWHNRPSAKANAASAAPLEDANRSAESKRGASSHTKLA